MTVALPVTHIISRKLNIVQKQLGEAKSWRIQLLRGFLNGIKTTKFLAWERKWEQMIMVNRPVNNNFTVYTRSHFYLFIVYFSFK